MHSWIVLSTFDASLDCLHISLELASAALLGVVHQGGFSSHSVYTRLMERLSYDHWVCLFLQGEFPTPWFFGENLRTPLCYQGFLFLVFFVWHFSGGCSEVVSKIYLLPISTRAAEVFFMLGILGVLLSCYQVDGLAQTGQVSWGARSIIEGPFDGWMYPTCLDKIAFWLQAAYW